MKGIIRSKSGTDKTPHSLGQGKKASLPQTEAAMFGRDEKFAVGTGHDHYGDGFGILSILEQLVNNGIRNFFCDPQNSHIIAKCLAKTDQMKAPDFGTPRDISKQEVLRPRDLPQVTSLSRTNIWRLEKAGLFVKKLKLSSGCVGYLRSDVQEWVANRHIILGEKP